MEEQRKYNIFGPNLPLFTLKMYFLYTYISRNDFYFSPIFLTEGLSFLDTINQHRALISSFMSLQDLYILHKVQAKYTLPLECHLNVVGHTQLFGVV